MQPEAEERWAIIKSMALEYYALHKNRFQLWKYTGQLEEWLNKHEVIKTYPLAFASCKFYIFNFLIYVAENGITDNPSAAYDAFKEDIQKSIGGTYEVSVVRGGIGNPATYEDVPRIQGITTS